MELFKNLFMYEAEGSNFGDGQSSSNENNDDNQDMGTPDEAKNTENTIPYERFKKVNDNYKQVKQQLDELLAFKQQQEEESRKKQGEYESLYNELKAKHDPLNEQFEKYQSVFSEMLTNRLEEVPEEFRDLIPQGNELEQLNWIENANKKGLFKKTVQSFGNSGTNPVKGDNQITQEEFNNMKYTERVRLKVSNPSLYERLAKQ